MLISAIIARNPKNNKNEVTVFLTNTLPPDTIEKIKKNLLYQGCKTYNFQGTVENLRKFIQKIKQTS